MSKKIEFYVLNRIDGSQHWCTYIDNELVPNSMFANYEQALKVYEKIIEFDGELSELNIIKSYDTETQTYIIY
jgi:hypothetical protein